MPQCLTTGAIRRIDLSPCLLLDRNRGDESFSSFSRLTCTALKERAPHAQAFVLVYRASARDRRTVPPQASAAWSCHKATSLLHDGGPAPASLSRGWLRRRGAAHPKSGRPAWPGRMPPTMGSRLGVRGLGPLTLRDVDGSGGRAAKEEGSGGAVSSGRCPPRDASGFRRLDPEDAAVAARGGGEEVPRDERYGRQCGSGR